MRKKMLFPRPWQSLPDLLESWWSGCYAEIETLRIPTTNGGYLCCELDYEKQRARIVEVSFEDNPVIIKAPELPIPVRCVLSQLPTSEVA